jgi:hypothetical protein
MRVQSLEEDIDPSETECSTIGQILARGERQTPFCMVQCSLVGGGFHGPMSSISMVCSLAACRIDFPTGRVHTRKGNHSTMIIASPSRHNIGVP